jgi:predicted ATPase/transcriptional regulator with XRE-family HTH domain
LRGGYCITVRAQANFGTWLKDRRKTLDLTQEALAGCAACSSITVRKIEAGNYRPSRQIAQRLAKCMEVPVDGLDAFIDAARAGRHPGSIASRPGHPTNLNRPLTPLIGRERTVRMVCERLMNPRTTLLSLTGPPGIGKTRLSLEVAAELLNEFEDGVFFVPLATVDNVELVPIAIAETLQVQEVAGRSHLALKDHVRDKQVLLVLDNFEQIVGAAPVLVDLLSVSPYLKLLVTTREALHVRGERRFPVPPLELPDLSERSRDALARNPSVQLFVDRAQATDPDFYLTDQNAAAVATICARLDGLPLAIELSAARIKLLSPQEIQLRLAPAGTVDPARSRLELLTTRQQDVPARQRTLRGAIDWSHNLLDRGEQILFARLGVFAGGFTLASAQSICNSREDLPLDVPATIESLLDKSLLRPQPRQVASVAESSQHSHETAARGTEPFEAVAALRFTMLETIREYAMERLAERGEEEETRQYHAEYFLELAETAGPELRGSRQATWINRLEGEYDNIRAALAWSLGNGDVEAGLHFAAALGWFWFVRGHFGEGRIWLESALAKIDSMPSKVDRQTVQIIRTRGRILNSLGRLAVRQTDLAAAERFLEESLELWRGLEDLRGVASALGQLGFIAIEHGDFARAYSLMEESLDNWRVLGERLGIAEALHGLGIIAGDTGHYDHAARLLSESLAIHRELADRGAMANALQNLGGVEMSRGNYDQAALLIEESMALAQEQGINWLVADAQLLGASLALRLGNPERCGVLLGKCLPYYQEAGSLARVTSCLAVSAELAHTEAQAQRGRAAGPNESQAHLSRAARLLGAVYALRAAAGAAILPADPDNTDRTLAFVKAALDEKTFSRAWAEGTRMTVDRAITHALDAHLT